LVQIELLQFQISAYDFWLVREFLKEKAVRSQKNTLGDPGQQIRLHPVPMYHDSGLERHHLLEIFWVSRFPVNRIPT
jgi:hypothetical protein